LKYRSTNVFIDIMLTRIYSDTRCVKRLMLMMLMMTRGKSVYISRAVRERGNLSRVLSTVRLSMYRRLGRNTVPTAWVLLLHALSIGLYRPLVYYHVRLFD